MSDNTDNKGTVPPRRQPVQVFLKRLYWIGFIPTMVSVALQMSEVHGGFLTNYLADVAGPIRLFPLPR